VPRGGPGNKGLAGFNETSGEPYDAFAGKGVFSENWQITPVHKLNLTYKNGKDKFNNNLNS
jgi:hypothetical protein